MLNVVVPYSDQQRSATFGGPIRNDKLHFFANYDYEHQPITSSTFPKRMSRASRSQLCASITRSRLKTHLMTKVGGSNLLQPFGAGNSNHPGGTNRNAEVSRDYLVQLTQVLGNRTFNEIKGGLASYLIDQQAVTTWSHHWLAPDITAGGPRILLRGFSDAQNQNVPRHRIQKVWSDRDDLSWSYYAAGLTLSESAASFSTTMSSHAIASGAWAN